MHNADSPIYVCLDLEMNQPSKKIIEIGVVVANVKERKILAKQHFFVNPNEQLHWMIKRLTSIRQSDVDSAKDLLGAYKDLCLFLAPFKFRKLIIIWGGNDFDILKSQLDQARGEFKWIFGDRCIDAQTIHLNLALAKGEPCSGGLSKALKKYGLYFKGRKHRAADDAYNTMILWFKMLNRLKRIDK
jgi:inhibitor of KinA sporulation pathway (predicted exonuclease)